MAFLSDAQRKKVESIIGPIAEKYEVVPEHWIHGYDEGFSYCLECAEAKIVELLKEEPKADYHLGGGSVMEGDTLARCDKCYRVLRNSLTHFGCEDELDHWERVKIKTLTPDLCYSFEAIIDCDGWDGDLGKRIDKLARRILRLDAKIRKASE